MGRLILILRTFVEHVHIRIRLAKLYLCALIGCAAVFGYSLAASSFSPDMVLVGCGMLLLATGAATLNSLQEYSLDSKLERTKNRPLPQGTVRPEQAGLQAFILLVVGILVVYLATETLLPVSVAVFALFLYNGIYTPLKKKTVLAIVPGAVCGALPPCIGWLAGGGEIVSFPAALLFTLFILWQIPHFWLVMLRYQNDYDGRTMPSVLQQFDESGLSRFMVTWVGSMAVVMLLFTILIVFPSIRGAVAVNAALMVLVIGYGLKFSEIRNYRRVFIHFNLFFFLHMVLVLLGRVTAW
ncbi:MAG: protoheme IX farnesyltransferase [Desulforhopalus sp.]